MVTSCKFRKRNVERMAAKLNGGVGAGVMQVLNRFADVLDYPVMVTTGLSIQGLSPNHSSWVAIAKGHTVEQRFQYGPPISCFSRYEKLQTEGEERELICFSFLFLISVLFYLYRG